MTIKKPENIILILLVCCAILVLATLTRYFCLLTKLDLFTANIVFLIVVVFSVAVYISINSLIDYFLLPRIISSKVFERKESAKNEIKTGLKYIPNNVPTNEIRETFQETSDQKKQKLLKQALQYSQEVFAPYASDPELLRLCTFVEMYSNGEELKSIQPIKVDKQLKANDIYHYGWNIWNHFRITDQLSISHFLKMVFAPTLQEVSQIKTIKKKLRIPDANCYIPIKYKLDD
ncbi:hypothetical protein [Draconibacterium sediminis]|uniref:hypothetical protein n=1 Tax=Draconibacterium sediminis TaxID=1544798 RepID=UPI0006970159|nr:hypothetical protein [Draconibacterium sediminis]